MILYSSLESFCSAKPLLLHAYDFLLHAYACQAEILLPLPSSVVKAPCYLGLDIGTKRIGVALSDPSGVLASPLLTVYRTRPRDDGRAVARLARRHGCTAFVAGLPLHISGEPSPMAARVKRFTAELAEFSGLPIHLWDERLTTREAHTVLYAAGRPRAEHAGIVDQVAAVLILQGFLNAQADAQADARRNAEPTPAQV